MRKSLLIFLLFVVFACNDNQNENKQKKSPTVIETIGTHATTDSLKPAPIINLSEKPEPVVFAIPTKVGGSYIKHLIRGDVKIDLVPPVIKVLPVVVTDLNSCTTPPTTAPSKDQSPAAIGNFTTFTTDQGLALDVISCGYKDSKGNLWFGTDGGGVSRYDGKSFTNFTAAQGLANSVMSITEDKTGNLWFGTYGGGVSRYDGKFFKNFTTAQGLAYNRVKSITEDKTGNLWFGTLGGGVSRYDGNRVEAIEAALQRGEIIPERTQQDLKRENGKLVKSFTNFTTQQGLANNTVLSITQDSKGNLWFGTNGGGVSRYDGKRVEDMEAAEKRGEIIPQRTQQELKRKNGKLVKSFTNFTTQQGLANNIVLSITQDSKGNLWFGTNGGGMSRYDGNRVEDMEAAEKRGEIIPQGTQQDLKRKNGKLVKSFTNFTTQQGLANNIVLSITQDSKGCLWFGTNGGGVSRYDGKSFTNFTTAQGLANNSVWSITQDSKGDLWFGTLGGGVSRYDGRSFTNFTTAQGLENNKVRSITQDSKGDLWFGTEGGGVSRYDGKSFTNFTTQQGLAENIVLSITKDSRGDLWFGTSGGGVSRYDGQSFTNFTTAQGLANNIVWSIFQDSKGDLWFGTNGGGVSRYDGQSFTNFTTAQGLANNSVVSITQDSKGYLWFGTYGGGVSRYDGQSFTNFTTAQGLANNDVFSITQDSKGNLWFGTYGGGVSRYDGESFANFTTAQGLPNDGVTQVVITKQQHIAIGTNFGVGVAVFFTPKLRGNPALHNIPVQNNMNNEELKNYDLVIENYNSANGYPIKDVQAGPNCMFIDSKGIMWAGTGSDKTALVRFDYAAVLRNNQPPTVVIQNVKLNQENICWFNQSKKYQVSSIKTKKDSAVNFVDSATMLLAAFNAFGKIVPKEILDRQQKKFSGVQFDGITNFYPLPENLVLPYKFHNVSFDFNAIETGKPNLVNYQFMLEGYDDEWNPLTKITTASFGNINEGTYTFKVKAQSPEGVWCEPVAYTFVVLPPWWRTWWMYCIDATLFIILLLGIYKWRTTALRKRKDFLEITVVERTKEVVQQKHLVDEKQKEILDSINYAKRIQGAMFPDYTDILAAFPNSFVLFKPKDIVSGDFYFFHLNPSLIPKGRGVAFIAAGDCTGHGVPGAFMSMVGLSKLSDAVAHSSDTSEILKLLNIGIKTALRQSESNESTRDGMDIALCSLSQGEYEGEGVILHYAAANRPLYIIPRGQTNLKEIKATKRAIGGLTEDNQHFETHEIKLQAGDTIYLSTDGFADQFNGPKGKKLMTKKFKEILVDIQDKPMQEQGEYLDNFIENWKAGTEQVDDILVIGIRI